MSMMNMTRDIGDVIIANEEARVILGYDLAAPSPLRWRAERAEDYRFWTSVTAHYDIPYNETFASMVNIAKERGAKSIFPIYAAEDDTLYMARDHSVSMVGIMWSTNSLSDKRVADELSYLNEWINGQVFELTVQRRARYRETEFSPIWEHVETIGNVYERDIDARARHIMTEYENGVIA